MLGFHDQQQQQMQQMQMQGMMAMAAAGVPPVANTTAGIAAAPGGDVGVGVGFNNFMAGDMAQPTLLHQSTGADGSQAMLPPGADPAMAQVYAQMFSQITFQEVHHAQAAMSDLNGKALKGLEGTLRLAWASSPSGPSPSLPPPFRGWTMPTPSGAAIDPCAALAGSGAFTMPQTGVDWNNLGAASVPAAWPGVVAASDSTPATRGVPLSGDGAGMMLMGCTGLEGASSLLGSEAAMAAGAAFAGP